MPVRFNLKIDSEEFRKGLFLKKCQFFGSKGDIKDPQGIQESSLGNPTLPAGQ
jgi:hypothetical protein